LPVAAALVVAGSLFWSGPAVLGSPGSAPPASSGGTRRSRRAQAAGDRGIVGSLQPPSPDLRGEPGRARRRADRVQWRNAHLARGARRHRRASALGRAIGPQRPLSPSSRTVLWLLLVSAGPLGSRRDRADRPRQGEALRVEDDVGFLGCELEEASQAGW